VATANGIKSYIVKTAQFYRNMRKR